MIMSGIIMIVIDSFLRSYQTQIEIIYQVVKCHFLFFRFLFAIFYVYKNIRFIFK